MPRYYFNVEDGTYIPDKTGIELADLKEARRESMHRAAKILMLDGTHFWEGGMWRVSVTNVDGQVLFSLNFTGVIGIS